MTGDVTLLDNELAFNDAKDNEFITNANNNKQKGRQTNPMPRFLGKTLSQLERKVS